MTNNTRKHTNGGVKIEHPNVSVKELNKMVKDECAGRSPRSARLSACTIAMQCGFDVVEANGVIRGYNPDTDTRIVCIVGKTRTRLQFKVE